MNVLTQLWVWQGTELCVPCTHGAAKPVASRAACAVCARTPAHTALVLLDVSTRRLVRVALCHRHRVPARLAPFVYDTASLRRALSARAPDPQRGRYLLAQ
jgi:hypothetical protein